MCTCSDSNSQEKWYTMQREVAMLLDKTDQIKWNKLVTSQLAVWQVRQMLRGQQQPVSLESPWAHAFVTISRTHGASGDALAHELGKRLDWTVYDRELVEYIAQTANVRQQVVESFDEHLRSETEDWVRTLIDRQALGSDKYLRYLIMVMVTIAEHGQAIIVGRGGNFVLTSRKGLRVMITAPLDWRAKQIAERQNTTLKEAKKIIAEVDEDRLGYLHHYFHRDANDLSAYDLVINVAIMSREAVIEIIISAIEQLLGAPQLVIESGERINMIASR
jgi:cytidylate kinase